MKYILSTLVLFSSLAFGDTVVLYDDGSTYTLAEGESVYVSSGKLFEAKGSLAGRVSFSVADPHSKRDGVDVVEEAPVELPSCGELGFGHVPCEPEPEPEVEDPQPCDELGFGAVNCEQEEEEEEEDNGDFTFGRPASLNPFKSGK